VAQTNKRLWVLRDPDEIAEYDPMTFILRQTLKLPPQVLKDPYNLAINNKGQMLFVPTLVEDALTSNQSASARKIWLWNGQTATVIDHGVTRKSSPAGSNLSVVEATPSCFLSADGRHLYWLENEFSKLKNGEGMDLSVTALFRAWETDLAGNQRSQIAVSSFASCQCETGVCSETCPEADFWVPDDGVDDFFIVTDWVPGQIGPTYHSSFLYRKAGEKWSRSKLSQVMERVLDADQEGMTVVQALQDAGCCGWVNESNDQTLLTSNNKSIVLFDERQRYANANYDVSFFTSSARLSPDIRFVAMTISSSAQPGAEIRLADGGRSDPKELARIRQALTGLPAVEILRLENSAKPVALIPHASLVGWLNPKEILVVEDHILTVFNVMAGTTRMSQIKVPKESYVFVR
jgi:hypothetical protein